MILQTNQSINTLSLLLDIQAGEIVLELLKVQSIVKIPGDDNELIMLYHTSLQDFLITKSRSGYHFIDAPLQHIYMAVDCLTCLAKDSSEDFFDNSLRYAIVEWPHHIVLGLQEKESSHDEAIMGTLVYLMEHFLTFQGEKWNNSILHASYEDDEGVLSWLDVGVNLCQVSHNNSFDCFTVNILIKAERQSMATKTLFSILQKIDDIYLVRIICLDAYIYLSKICDRM